MIDPLLPINSHGTRRSLISSGVQSKSYNCERLISHPALGKRHGTPRNKADCSCLCDNTMIRTLGTASVELLSVSPPSATLTDCDSPEVKQMGKLVPWRSGELTEVEALEEEDTIDESVLGKIRSGKATKTGTLGEVE